MKHYVTTRAQYSPYLYVFLMVSKYILIGLNLAWDSIVVGIHISNHWKYISLITCAIPQKAGK